jgi:hypothetical protein
MCLGVNALVACAGDDCPMCPGRKITVRNHAISHRDDFERVTIVPSVRGTHHGPGRPCGFHANIVDGEVVPAQ